MISFFRVLLYSGHRYFPSQSAPAAQSDSSTSRRPVPYRRPTAPGNVNSGRESRFPFYPNLATSEFAVYDKEGNYEWYRSYGPGGSENIGQVGNGSCTDINVDVANDLFYGFKSSSAHWSDISNPEYTGVGIGVVVIQKGMGYDAYCCILTMDRTYG